MCLRKPLSKYKAKLRRLSKENKLDESISYKSDDELL